MTTTRFTLDVRMDGGDSFTQEALVRDDGHVHGGDWVASRVAEGALKGQKSFRFEGDFSAEVTGVQRPALARSFDECVGRTITAVTEGSSCLCLSFSDGTAAVVTGRDPYNCGVGFEVETDVENYALKEFGLISEEEYDLRVAKKAAEDKRRTENAQRKQWEELNKKFGE